MKKKIQIRVSTKALRCIDKAGGLDNYLLKTQEALLPGLGLDLKRRVIQAIERNQKETQTQPPSAANVPQNSSEVNKVQ